MNYKNKYLSILLCFGVFFSINSRVFSQTIEERTFIEEGNKFYEKKDFDKARALYAKTLISDPSSLKANYNLGNTFYQLKKWDQAKTHYTKAAGVAQKKEDKANIYYNLGNISMQEKNFPEALKNYKTSLKNNPSDNQTRYNYALAKRMMDQQKQDKKDNKNKLPQPSEFAKELKFKADGLSKRGEFGEAFQLMQNGLKKDSTVAHYQSFMQKLQDVITIDSLTVK